MKHLFIFISVFVLTACTDKSLSTVEGTIDVEKYKAENTWVYLYTIICNDYRILDSCLVRNGRFRLTSDLPYEYYYTLFTPARPAWHELVMRPGDRLEVHLSDKTDSRYLIIPESYATMARWKEYEEGLKYGKIWRKLSDSLVFLNPQAPEYARLKDSIDALNRYRHIQLPLDLLNDEKVKDSPYVCNLLVFFLEYRGLPRKQLDSIKAALLARFPDDHASMSSCTGVPSPPMSREGFRDMNRIYALMNLPQVPEFHDESENEQRLPENYVKPEPYKIGDLVDKDIFNDFDTSFPDIRTDYTLVDFWASWCAPCCAEIPELLKTKTEYDDLLTVYAVSLDYHPEHWHKAMASYEIEKSFVNIMLPRKHERYQYILDKFDVSAIPANFLLDKDRRIIATGLRGEDLKNKMKELTGK